MDKKLRWIVFGAFITGLCVLTAVLALRTNRDAVKLSVLEPRTVITPTPALEEFSPATPTPAATPVHIIQTPAPVLPKTAVNLLVDGTALLALDSRETAKLLIDAYFERCAYENIGENTFLLKASVAPELSTVPADGSVEYLTYEEALNKLLKNRSYISVQRTLEHAEIRFGEVADTEETSPLLPKGARLYRRLGAPSRTIVLTEILYKDGIAYKETETIDKQIFAGVPRSVLTGSYMSKKPDEEPDDAQGEYGKDKGSLSFKHPVRGTIVSYFGTRYGQMHYGIDFLAKAGAQIVAPESGTVIFCGTRAGYGFVIDIRHENGFVSRIAGCDDVQVEFEEHVTAGQRIASVPSPVGTETAIVHYELLIDGIPYNPLYYLG